MNKKRWMGSIVGTFIIIIIGITLLPTVAQQVGTAQADGNVTGVTNTLVGLTTLFFTLAIIITAVGIAVSGLKDYGFVRNREDDYEEDDYEEDYKPTNITINNTKTKKTSLGSPQKRKNL